MRAVAQIEAFAWALVRGRQVEIAMHAIRAALDALNLTADERRSALDAAAASLESGR